MSATESTREFVQRWRSARRVVVLTGAGLSTASGIPDFRSPGGRWENYQPIPFPDFLASEEARREYWRYKGETWQVIQSAQPNAAHQALARLAHAGCVELLVTQNVDGLHERSGFPGESLINIHGTDSAVSCVGCDFAEPRERAQAAWEAGDEVPRCACGSALKPATISFGQQLVAEDLERAMHVAGECELFVAVGTSLVVSPINSMFEVAGRSGAATAILTASETPYDGYCDFRFSDPVQDLLPLVARQVLAR
ncbi:Sir2 family NAD-dependent protein deacetylase [Myxococcota bacterium]|nr:Sir2 family NAD-dependent protein deacetylase [Myxococcota bacterium]